MSSPEQTPPVATRQSRRTVLPLPEKRTRLTFSRRFSPAEFAQVSRGFIPKNMDQKWFIFLEENRLYFHRSWTGKCIYEVHLASVGDEVEVAKAWVNRDAEQYGGTDDAYDAALLTFLIDNLLLGGTTPFPIPADAPPAPPGLLQHHVSGTGYAEVPIAPEADQESGEENK